jgi:hypothetical protein
MKVIGDEGYFAQSMLLSKALRMQQDLEDKKTEVIIEGLERKIKDHEAALEKKDFVLQTMEGSLTEAQAECHTRVLGHQDPGANIITRCAGTKSHTYDESWHRIECHIFTI